MVHRPPPSHGSLSHRSPHSLLPLGSLELQRRAQSSLALEVGETAMVMCSGSGQGWICPLGRRWRPPHDGPPNCPRPSYPPVQDRRLLQPKEDNQNCPKRQVVDKPPLSSQHPFAQCVDAFDQQNRCPSSYAASHLQLPAIGTPCCRSSISRTGSRTHHILLPLLSLRSEPLVLPRLRANSSGSPPLDSLPCTSSVEDRAENEPEDGQPSAPSRPACAQRIHTPLPQSRLRKAGC